MRSPATRLVLRAALGVATAAAPAAPSNAAWAASVDTPLRAAGSDATSSPASAPAAGVATEAADVPTPALAAATSAAAGEPDPFEVDPAEPDFSVINLPTTLRPPRHRMAFRLTHRFARGLGQGDFGDLASDFFGFDGGAQIGIELRYGLARDTQFGVLRTSDRTIEFFVQQSLLREGPSAFGLALSVSIEGLDNFGQDYSPRVALVGSKRLGRRGALYLVPAFVGNTRVQPVETGDDATLVLGIGARFGLGAGVALVGEVSPRLAGYDGGPNAATHATFGIEKRVGGHSFQLNFSNDLGTTPAQVARGRQGRDDWFLGFNLSRKFY